MTSTYEIQVVGSVRSALVDRRDAPNQGDEGAPDAWLDIDDEFSPALRGLGPGDPIIVITWLHHGARDALVTHPRGDPTRTPIGVFGTRSPDRPNPVGLHETAIIEIDGNRVLVRALEAIDGTPIVDIKPVLGAIAER